MVMTVIDDRGGQKTRAMARRCTSLRTVWSAVSRSLKFNARITGGSALSAGQTASGKWATWAWTVSAVSFSSVAVASPALCLWGSEPAKKEHTFLTEIDALYSSGDLVKLKVRSSCEYAVRCGQIVQL